MSTPQPEPSLSLHLPGASGGVPFDDETPDQAAALAAELGETASPGNDLEALRSELQREEETVRKEANPDVVYGAPGRPGYSLRFSTDLQDDDLKVGRARSRSGNRADRRSGSGDLDQMKWNLWLLATYNTAILRNGNEIALPGGGVLRFATREFLEITGTSTITAGIRKFFAEADGAIVGMGMAVLQSSSWGTEPTEGDGDLVAIPPTRER